MGVTASEWTMLSLLLNHKAPNSRMSELALSDKIFPIKGPHGYEIKNLEEVKEILNSLERKGIIKIEEIFEPSNQSKDTEVLEHGEDRRELEKINLLYIMGKIDATEYEKKFFEIFSKTRVENKGDIIPLTLIERYVSISSLLHIALTFANSKLSTELSSFTQLESIESLIRTNISQVLENLSNLLFRYLQTIKKEIEVCEDKMTTIFVYLYPLIKDLIKEKKLTVDEESREKMFKQMEELKKSIEVEKEVISVLKMLNEDERKIKTHEDKLRKLEDKLNEISEKVEKEGIVIEFPSSGISVDWIRNKLIATFGGSEPAHHPSLRKFVDELSNLLYEEFSKINLSINQERKKQQPQKESLHHHCELHIPIHIHKILSEGRKDEFKENYYCSLKVSLIWMNDLCPIMMDSTIESKGGELTMCKNLECFVIYHKKCLEKLLRTNVNTCMVCGYPIKSY